MIKRNFFLTLLTALPFLGVQFGANAQSGSKFTIKGVIDTVPHATYAITYLNKGLNIHDTLTLDASRKFEYVGKISEPTIFSMTIENTINKNLIGPTYVYSFWVEPGKIIKFSGKTGWLVKSAFGLGAITDKYQLENSSMKIAESDYNKTMSSSLLELAEKVGKSFNDALRKQAIDSIKAEFIDKHRNSYYSLYLLKGDMRSSKPDFTAVEKSLNKLSNEVRNTSLGKLITQQVALNRSSVIGKTMPEFEYADTISKIVKLSNYRGKYLLVDFWASWCGPCRAENPNILAAYKKYSPQGFEILAISLDTKKEDWLKAIHEDQLPWTQVSDFQGFNNTLYKTFLMTGIPDNFLLDPNGVIIARGLQGEHVEEQLDKIFKK